MSTDSALSVVNVFSTLADYNSNKSNIPDGQLILAPVEDDFIESSVDTTGFVHFKNGLLIQWGEANCSGGTIDIVFQRAYTTRPQAYVSAGSDRYENAAIHDRPTTIGFSIHTRGKEMGTCSWFAIGMGV